MELDEEAYEEDLVPEECVELRGIPHSKHTIGDGSYHRKQLLEERQLCNATGLMNN